MSDPQPPVDPQPAGGETLEFPNQAGKHEVSDTCPGCSNPVNFHVPDGIEDATVRYEHTHPDGSITKGEWVNPDAEPVLDPGSADVIWDAANQRYVARLRDSGGGADATPVDASPAAVAG